MRKFFGSRLFQYTALLSVPLLAAAILFPVFAHKRELARRASCQSNLKQIGLGFMQYLKDYDNRLPLTRVNSLAKVKARRASPSDYETAFGWADGIQPYMKSVCVLNCPCEVTNSSNLSDPTLPGFTDYWMNENLSARRDETLIAPEAVLLLGDGEGSADSTSQYGKRALSTEPLVARHGDYTQGPCYERHLGGANYAFADGHMKWLLREQISTARSAPYTFAPH